MTKKDYIKFAEMFKRQKADCIECLTEDELPMVLILWRDVVVNVADIFMSDNPRFDRDKFYKACNFGGLRDEA